MIHMLTQDWQIALLVTSLLRKVLRNHWKRYGSTSVTPYLLFMAYIFLQAQDLIRRIEKRQLYKLVGKLQWKDESLKAVECISLWRLWRKQMLIVLLLYAQSEIPGNILEHSMRDLHLKDLQKPAEKDLRAVVIMTACISGYVHKKLLQICRLSLSIMEWKKKIHWKRLYFTRKMLQIHLFHYPEERYLTYKST